MTRIAGIVAEFNPFHSGHAALIRAAKEQVSGVVAVMSGNFVQRGSPAITDKRVRTRAALLCGVDLVLELPLSYATAPAQRFARGAIGTLATTGVVDILAFGSECGELSALQALAEAVDNKSVINEMKRLLTQGMTFARARELAVAHSLDPQLAHALAAPNNLLGVEYLRAAAALGWHPQAITLRRQGVGHDSPSAKDGYASGSFLRQNAGDFALLCRYLPEQAALVLADALADGLYPTNSARLETAILAHLRRLSSEELSRLPDLSEGLENRLMASIRIASTLADLENALKTKRYTMARVRRLILSAFLGLTEEDVHTPIPYIRVLGFTHRGRKILSGMKGICKLPVSTSLARLRSLGGSCERFASLEETSTDLYALCLPKPVPCGYEYTASAVYFK